MAAPIMPAPTMPSFLNCLRGTSFGGEPPPLQYCRPKKKACVMVFEVEAVTSSTKYRVSTRVAYSLIVRCRPSTAAARIAFGAGIGAPLICLVTLAGKDGRKEASFGLVGVPPGTL